MSVKARAAASRTVGSAGGRIRVVLVALLLLAGAAVLLVTRARPSAFAASPTLRPVVTGLVNPRALVFGPDGALYVGEAGRAGPTAVRAGLDKVHYHIGRSARILRADLHGTVTTVAGALPSVHWGDDTYGVAGLAFFGPHLYALLGTGGRDVGDPGYANAVLRVGQDGALTPIANLTAYNRQQPPRARRLDPARTDVEGGVPFGFAALHGRLYATDGNQETVTEITPSGGLRRLLEYPASDHVLTGITPGPDGALYICEFGPAPHGPDTGMITRLTLDGQRSTVWSPLPAVIAVAFDPAGRLYALEFSTGQRVPHSGRLLRRGPDGQVEVLASGLNFPTALAFGPDGSLYMTLNGHRSENASGQVVQVDLTRRSPLQQILDHL